jgi:hypothetical protein
MRSHSSHPRVHTRAVLGLALLALATAPAAAQAAAPDNDAFADAQTVRVGDRLVGTLAEATSEAGEPATSAPPIAATGGAGKNRVTSRHFSLGGLTGHPVAPQPPVATRCTAGRLPLLATSRCP